jgi:hypothetical protein
MRLNRVAVVGGLLLLVLVCTVQSVYSQAQYFWNVYVIIYNYGPEVTITDVNLTYYGRTLAFLKGPFIIAAPKYVSAPTVNKIGPFIMPVTPAPNDLSFNYDDSTSSPIPFDIPSPTLQFNQVYVVDPTLNVSVVGSPWFQFVGGVSVPTNWTLTASGLRLQWLSLLAVPLATVAVAQCVKRLKKR